MSTNRPQSRAGRSAVLAILAILAIVVVAACGSSGSGASGSPGIFGQTTPAPSAASETPAPSTAATDEASAEPTDQPAATDEASSEPTDAATAEPTTAGSAEPSADTSQLAQAGSKLSDLSSYRLEVKMQGVSFLGTGSGSTMTMKATVVLKPVRALEFTMTGLDFGMASPGAEAAITYIIIGDKAWMTIGGMSVEAPADSAGSADQMFESLAPDKMFGSQYGSYLSGMQQVGTEQKNGVATVHYKGDEASLKGIAAAAGGADMPFDVSAWSMDVWVAQDGGYLVSALTKGVIQSGETKGDYVMEINISNINDPANKVSAPK
jgi:hypothetical protein